MISRNIAAIVIHCAATPNGRPYTAGQIDRDHEARGFKRAATWLKLSSADLPHIGYHYFLNVDGSRVAGRHLEEVGAHVQGSNARSIGICMAGTNKFTRMQWISAAALVVDLAKQLAESRVQQPYTIANADQALTALVVMGIDLLGHRDYSPDLNGDGVIQRTEWVKECPGFDVAEWRKAGLQALPGHTC
jgi:hypothetical protein